MEPLISVIVPVYNVEPYLRKCVDSILNQTYRNLEIILVDDGSPDNCGAICGEYAAKDGRIKVIHKENGGLSDARNAGLQVMSGSFLTFVDSDDMLPERAVELLANTASKTNADLVIGGYVRFEDIPPEETEAPASVQTMTGVEAMREFFRGGCASWARLYRREIHAELSFPVGEINEDEAIVLHILERCHRVACTNEIVYFYRCRPESITTMAFSPKKLAWPKHCRENLAFVQGKYPELELDAAARYRGSLLWALREIALSGQNFSKEVKLLQKELRSQHALFERAPFENGADKLRYHLLKRFPLWIYKTLLCLRHSA